MNFPQLPCKDSFKSFSFLQSICRKERRIHQFFKPSGLTMIRTFVAVSWRRTSNQYFYVGRILEILKCVLLIWYLQNGMTAIGARLSQSTTRVFIPITSTTMDLITSMPSSLHCWIAICEISLRVVLTLSRKNGRLSSIRAGITRE
jgi:hydrogenase-4 membrane subunit HyfE